MAKLKCPECSSLRVQVLRDLNEDGKPRPGQSPMYACLDCWHKWPVDAHPQLIHVPQARV